MSYLKTVVHSPWRTVPDRDPLHSSMPDDNVSDSEGEPLDGLSSLPQGVCAPNAVCAACVFCNPVIDFERSTYSKLSTGIRTYYSPEGMGKVHRDCFATAQRHARQAQVEQAPESVVNPEGRCIPCFIGGRKCNKGYTCNYCQAGNRQCRYLFSDKASRMMINSWHNS